MQNCHYTEEPHRNNLYNMHQIHQLHIQDCNVRNHSNVLHYSAVLQNHHCIEMPLQDKRQNLTMMRMMRKMLWMMRLKKRMNTMKRMEMNMHVRQIHLLTHPLQIHLLHKQTRWHLNHYSQKPLKECLVN